MRSETILDPLVGLCHRALQSTTGDRFAPIRFSREALRAINDLFGQPICSAQDRARRRSDRQQPIPPPPSSFRRNEPGPGGAV